MQNVRRARFVHLSGMCDERDVDGFFDVVHGFEVNDFHALGWFPPKMIYHPGYRARQ